VLARGDYVPRQHGAVRLGIAQRLLQVLHLAPVKAVYYQARPEAMGAPLAASARINEMIASAIRVDPTWFSKNVRAQVISAQLYRG
jgi:hypothetical protein